MEAGRRPLPLQQTNGINRQAMVNLASGVTLPTVTQPEPSALLAISVGP